MRLITETKSAGSAVLRESHLCGQMSEILLIEPLILLCYRHVTVVQFHGIIGFLKR